MKLQLKKKSIKALSQDKSAIPAAMTPNVAGGTLAPISIHQGCLSDLEYECYTGGNSSCFEQTCPIP